MRTLYQRLQTNFKAPSKLVENIKNANWDDTEFWSAINKNLVRLYLESYGFELEDGELLAKEIEKSLKTCPIIWYCAVFSN